LSALFGIFFTGKLPESVARAYGYTKAARRAEAPKPQEVALKPADGALQLLGILQREARLVDFLMEDVAPYSDEQVGAAVRNVHAHSRDALKKHFAFAPVIDGVEGAFAKAESAGAVAKDPAALKFVGNLPAQGKPSGGVLRHKGWRIDDVRLPAVTGKVNLSILAPAELEVE
jgi:hypothetical protein